MLHFPEDVSRFSYKHKFEDFRGENIEQRLRTFNFHVCWTKLFTLTRSSEKGVIEDATIYHKSNELKKSDCSSSSRNVIENCKTSDVVGKKEAGEEMSIV